MYCLRKPLVPHCPSLCFMELFHVLQTNTQELEQKLCANCPNFLLPLIVLYDAVVLRLHYKKESIVLWLWRGLWRNKQSKRKGRQLGICDWGWVNEMKKMTWLKHGDKKTIGEQTKENFCTAGSSIAATRCRFSLHSLELLLVCDSWSGNDVNRTRVFFILPFHCPFQMRYFYDFFNIVDVSGDC